ncbi:MAG: HAD hydrolase family protein [Lachnospiraceae bacterium]|jgi:3-deoxy-D-manno-octulosonate 8-phosphate phosphatase (KDO 8-P phosphatase)|nr:HAD hydrolase family protein [Lachnospiraceae bacterium]
MVKLNISHLIMDVDGTLTDGQVYIGEHGELCKGFYVRDGLGIKKAMAAGIKPVILTSRESEIVKRRCEELGIKEIYQGVENKEVFLRNYVKEKDFSLSSIAYIGDDENDLGAISLVGLAGCPLDAVDTIKAKATFISRFKGGNGAVREFCELIIEKNSKRM